MTISYLQARNIDKTRWDEAVRKDPGHRIYGLSFYLDLVCPEAWDALVGGEYESVMPLPWNRKLVLYPQIYRPPFCQQLGILGGNAPDPEGIARFIGAIPRQYRLIRYPFSSSHRMPEGIEYHNRRNFYLELKRSYTEVESGYRNRLRKNLRSARNKGLQFEPDAGANAAMGLIIPHYLERIPDMRKMGRRFLDRYFKGLSEQGTLTFPMVLDQDGRPLATSAIVRYNGRLYNMVSATAPAGRGRNATHFLLDRILHGYAGQDITFDFEGSDIPGVASFYRDFGPQEEIYFEYHRDRLPALVRWMKKLFNRS